MVFTTDTSCVPIMWWKAVKLSSKAMLCLFPSTEETPFWINFAACWLHCLFFLFFFKFGQNLIVSFNWNINIVGEGKAFCKPEDSLNVTLELVGDLVLIIQRLFEILYWDVSHCLKCIIHCNSSITHSLFIHQTYFGFLLCAIYALVNKNWCLFSESLQFRRGDKTHTRNYILESEKSTRVKIG